MHTLLGGWDSSSVAAPTTDPAGESGVGAGPGVGLEVGIAVGAGVVPAPRPTSSSRTEVQNQNQHVSRGGWSGGGRVRGDRGNGAREVSRGGEVSLALGNRTDPGTIEGKTKRGCRAGKRVKAWRVMER